MLMPEVTKKPLSGDLTGAPANTLQLIRRGRYINFLWFMDGLSL
jgi:hypothetical protein